MGSSCTDDSDIGAEAELAARIVGDSRRGEVARRQAREGCGRERVLDTGCVRDWEPEADGRVGDALRVGVAGGQGEARRGRLRAGRAARRRCELVDRVGAAVHDPEVADVGRVERDARRAGAGAA